MQSQEHDLGITGNIFFRIQFLQAFHGFKAKRGGCIVQPQEIGRKVHHHMSHGRVLFRHFREQPGKKWAYQPGKKPDSPGLLAYAHEAEEQRHDTDQFERQLNTVSGRFKNAVYDHFEDQRIVQKSPFYECDQESHQKKA
jgi:hypothetical protein